MSNLWIWFAVIILIIIGVSIIILSTKKFEIAILLVTLSPWMSALFVVNAPGYQGEAEPVLGAYIRIAMIGLAGIIGLIVFLTNGKANDLPFSICLLGIFILCTFASTFYSLDQRHTFIRSCTFLAIFFFLIGFYAWVKNEGTFEKALNSLSLVICFFLIANLCALIFFPEKAWHWSMEDRFQGFWGHPNSIGALSMVSYPVLLWKFRQSSGNRKWVLAGYIVICALMHFLSGSRGTIAASVIGICIWLLMIDKKTNLIIFFITIALCFGAVIKIKPTVFMREKTFNLANLTGRTDFWSGAYMLIKEKPLHGYGYEVEGKVWNDIRFYNPEIGLWRGSVRASLHNGYLSVLIGVGLIGFAIWCFVLFLPLWQCFFSPSNLYKTFAVSIMVMCLVLNSIETIITGSGALTAIFFWIAWVMAVSLARSAKIMSNIETA